MTIRTAHTAVGCLELLDLDLIGTHQGRYFMPFPFMYTRPTRFAWAHELDEYATTVPGRLARGDLSQFRSWVNAYNAVDIEVACHVQSMRPDTPSTRIMAFRSGQRGFMAKQRHDDDSIDIDLVSPYELGAVIADAVQPFRPGRHRRIVVPEFVRAERPAPPDEIVVRHTSHSALATAVAPESVTGFATVQSRWQPARRWGLDERQPIMVCVSVDDDGDYLFTPDLAHAVPMTDELLRGRIDRLIADDIVKLREHRDLISESFR